MTGGTGPCRDRCDRFRVAADNGATAYADLLRLNTVHYLVQRIIYHSLCSGQEKMHACAGVFTVFSTQAKERTSVPFNMVALVTARLYIMYSHIVVCQRFAKLQMCFIFHRLREIVRYQRFTVTPLHSSRK